MGVDEIRQALRERIVVLDGAMGTMIQRLGLKSDDFYASDIDSGGRDTTGCNDLLTLTRPDCIKNIHAAYLAAGADIIETDTFNANALSLADYGVSHLVREINTAGVRVARQAIAERGKRAWVAGSVGPGGHSLSLGGDIESGGVDWDAVEGAAYEQIAALIEAGADLLLLETVFDGLNAKAMISAAIRAMNDAGREIPVMVSATLNRNGRLLSGQTLAAFVTTISHVKPISVGLNCGFGADELAPFVEALQDYPFAVSLHPNAGLPDTLGNYSQTPDVTVAYLRPLLSSGKLNIVGGCCGTTPEHIAAIAKEVTAHGVPRSIPKGDGKLHLAGLEDLPLQQFYVVGERCNVAGSRKFLRLIKEGALDECAEIASAQLSAGAHIIDVNMDDPMIDAGECAVKFIDRLSAEPSTARAPLMIDTSDWSVVRKALKHVQGKPVVNSISLKEGERVFIDHARELRRAGAAVVVMAFDEEGQAATYERRIQVCERAYRLLTADGFPPEDIIFDPNVLAIATGIESHDNYAVDFIRAAQWIRTNLPGAHVSGGLSNLSFSYRGNEPVRAAMHAVFLNHARQAGLDMAIVNPGQNRDVSRIEPELARCVEDVVMNSDAGATGRLTDLAVKLKQEAEMRRAGGSTASKPHAEQKTLSCSERAEEMIVKGQTEGMEVVLGECHESMSAYEIVDGPLMRGMNRVGDLFGRGLMFLPQVVRSAKSMKYAVEILTPWITGERKKDDGASGAGKLVLATVKGDVHDIGKNIVGVIMSCNGYDVVDLGVMVPGEKIVDTAVAQNASFIGLSGLITPSLSEMCEVARELERRGLKIPLLVGGAAASELHTAVKIAPLYSGPVIYTSDAAALPGAVRNFGSTATIGQATAALRARQEQVRRKYAGEPKLLSLEESRKRKHIFDISQMACTPAVIGKVDVEIRVDEVRELINWRAFFAAWKLDASFADIADVRGCDHVKAQWLASLPAERRAKGAEALQLFKEANRMIDRLCAVNATLCGRLVLSSAHSEGDDIVIESDGVTMRVPTMRQQSVGDRGECVALADYVGPVGAGDHVALFAVTSAGAVEAEVEEHRAAGDDYGLLLSQSVADRLVEASTEWLHRQARTVVWGYSDGAGEDNPRNLLLQYYRGIRPAIGYPSLADQSLVFETDKLLHYNEIGVTLTENGAMSPAASTTGLMIGYGGSRYFIVGAVDSEQKADYAARRGMDEGMMKRYLG